MYTSIQFIWQHFRWNTVAIGFGVVVLLYGAGLQAQSPQDEIAAELTNAKCGGWIPFDTNFPSVVQFIATVTGVPGRDGEPLGHIPSGMARRVETGGVDGRGFKFPGDTTGFSSACRPGDPPWYQNHPCQRPGPGVRGLSERVFGSGSPNSPTSDPLTAGVTWSCDALCIDLNQRWKRAIFVAACADPDNPANGRATLSCRCYDKPNEPPPDPCEDPPDGCSWVYTGIDLYCCTLSLEAPNCQQCSGQDCRGEHQVLNGFQSNGRPYLSYFRQYENGTCQRSPIPAPYVEDDSHERINVPVACYGLWDEYDPKTRVSRDEDFSCVIANTFPNPANPPHHFLDMGETQRSNTAAVDYGQLSDWPDPPELDFDPNRAEDFNADEDVWFPINGGFSLINNGVLEERYNDDLTYAILAPDETEFRTYPQLTLDQKLSTGALLRAFDDTATTEPPDRFGRRTLVEWWQEVETQMNEFLAPPSLRVIVPAPWVVGLDREDPFVIEDVITTTSLSEKPESVEVILQAKEDLLGELAAYFERTQLIQIKEEEIPLVIPLASPVELRALSDAWCAWHMEREQVDNCNVLPPDVGNMIQRLEEYAVFIDEVRKLRGELYYYETSVLERQQLLLFIMELWLEDTAAVYNNYIESLNELRPYRQAWRDMQNIYRDFHDKTNFPWCMNDRFTVPIYSLLDNNWFPGRPDLTGGIDDDSSLILTNFNVLPRLDVYLPKADPDALDQNEVVVDLSHLYAYADSLRIPVLKPTQVRLEWDAITPPAIDDPVPEPPPPLPPVPTIHAEVNAKMPPLDFNSFPPFIFTYLPDATLSIDLLFFGRVQQFLLEMTESYDLFWTSLKIDPEEVDDGTEEDCLFPHTSPCAHVEMDLSERFQRMCARPAILLKEDFDAIGHEWKSPELKDYESCPREDWACQILFRDTEQGRKGWWIQYPEEDVQDELVGGIRRRIFNETLLREGVAEEDRLRYIVTPSELLPTFNVPKTESPMPDFPVLAPEEE